MKVQGMTNRSAVCIGLAVLVLVLQFNFFYFYQYEDATKSGEDLQDQISNIDHRLSSLMEGVQTLTEQSLSFQATADDFQYFKQKIMSRKKGGKKNEGEVATSGSTPGSSKKLQEGTDISTNVQRRLLLASHGSLVWYDIAGDRFQLLGDSMGIYYSSFPGPKSDELFVVSSRLDIGEAKEDEILQLNSNSGEVVSSYKIPSTFTHDTVLSLDKSKAYIADTSTGTIVVVSYPDMNVIDKIEGLFNRKHHINTLAPTKDGNMWVMQHNVGPSEMTLVNLETKQVTCRLKNVGVMAHGLVKVAGENAYIILSSKEVALVKVIIPTTCEGDLAAERQILWQYDAEGQQKFLKGLAVLDNVAYFGMCNFEGTREGRLKSKVTLLAYDLREKSLRWSRNNVGTVGLLNTITTPHLSSTSPYMMQRSSSALVPPPPLNSCIRDYLSLLKESKKRGVAFGKTGEDIFFIKLPLKFDVEALRKEQKELEKSVEWTLRPDVNNYFILLVTQNGVPTDQTRAGPFIPVADRLSKIPYTRKVLSSIKSPIGRSRYMRLQPKTNLEPHVDTTNHITRGTPFAENGYWGRRFRVHIPITSDEHVIFGASDKTSDVKLHMEEGYAYLFDNSNKHYVLNPTDTTRDHLVFDTVGTVELFKLIQKSTVIKRNGLQYAYYSDEAGTSGEEVLVADDGTDQEIIYETWTDAPVFMPMSTKEISKFLNDYIFSLIDIGDPKLPRVQQILMNFLKNWDVQCYLPMTKETKLNMKEQGVKIRRKCMVLAKQLLVDVLEMDMCAADYSKSMLMSTGEPIGMSLSNAVEAIVRMAYYECVGTNLFTRVSSYGPPCGKPTSPLRPLKPKL